ncbi:hypothetical protein CEP53_002080 [Fusarium sp. AF-6]|nr:hypothetical protein CEP53_002080 [Fusarium sp. AF-6]
MLPRSTLCLNEPYLIRNTAPIYDYKSCQFSLHSSNRYFPSTTTQHNIIPKLAILELSYVGFNYDKEHISNTS